MPEPGQSIRVDALNAAVNALRQATGLAGLGQAAMFPQAESYDATANRIAEERYQRELWALPFLKSSLSERQAKQLRERGRFLVVAPSGNKYAVCMHEQVFRLTDDLRIMKHLCAYPPNLTTYERMLAQKLILENDEMSFLAVACPSPLCTGERLFVEE